MPNTDDHDILIRIDQNLKNLIQNFNEHKKIFDEHEKGNVETFTKHDNRIKSIEKTIWMVGGIVLAIDAVIRFFIK